MLVRVPVFRDKVMYPGCCWSLVSVILGGSCVFTLWPLSLVLVLLLLGRLSGDWRLETRVWIFLGPFLLLVMSWF